MSNFSNYLWQILLAIYIISPIDAVPHFIDDLIASGVLFYLIYKNSKRKKHYQQSYSNSYSHNQSQYNKSTTHEAGNYMTLDKAYELLDVKPNASLEDINKSYKERMSKSHPDKVSHLGKELQDKASEITLKLNTAVDMIRKSRGN